MEETAEEAPDMMRSYCGAAVAAASTTTTNNGLSSTDIPQRLPSVEGQPATPTIFYQQQVLLCLLERTRVVARRQCRLKKAIIPLGDSETVQPWD